MAYILAVVACGLSGLHAARFSYLPKQLLAELIVTHHRVTLIARPVVDIQDIFHVSHKVGVLLGRDTPALLQPRFEFTFFNSSPTVW